MKEMRGMDMAKKWARGQRLLYYFVTDLCVVLCACFAIDVWVPVIGGVAGALVFLMLVVLFIVVCCVVTQRKTKCE